MDIQIKQMTLSDLDQVMEIEPVAFGSHHWSRQSFANELSNSTGYYFVARKPEADQLYGYTGFWLIGEEAHITTLAVHPELRRRHIGERLLIHDIIEAKAVGAKWMTLEVRVSNESAQNLYYKYGFKSLGLRRSYYQDNNEDAMVLWTDNICTAQFENLVDERIQAIKEMSLKVVENDSTKNLLDLSVADDTLPYACGDNHPHMEV